MSTGEMRTAIKKVYGPMVRGVRVDDMYEGQVYRIYESLRKRKMLQTRYTTEGQLSFNLNRYI